MKASNQTAARSSSAPSATAASTCRKCGTKLANLEYYCPECATPHFPHLKTSLLSPSIKFLAFFAVIAGPIAAYTFWEVLTRFSFKI